MFLGEMIKDKTSQDLPKILSFKKCTFNGFSIIALDRNG
jgi:hypothetical protein